jgi:hypothetical protein
VPNIASRVVGIVPVDDVDVHRSVDHALKTSAIVC